MDIAEHKSQRGLLDIWRGRPLWQRLVFIIVVSALPLCVMIFGPRVADCPPTSHDGQCGLATFDAFFEAALASVILLVASLVATLSDWFWSQRKIKRDGVR
jgi:hypothetical protein